MLNFFRKFRLLLKLFDNIEISKDGNITVNRCLNISVNGDLVLGTTGHHIEYSTTGCKIMYYKKLFSGSIDDNPNTPSMLPSDIVVGSINEVNMYYMTNKLPYKINELTYKTESFDTSKFLLNTSCNI
jgi:hypothetical protein